MANLFIIGKNTNPEYEHFGKLFVVLRNGDEDLLVKEPFDTEKDARSWIALLKRAAGTFTKVVVRD